MICAFIKKKDEFHVEQYKRWREKKISPEVNHLISLLTSRQCKLLIKIYNLYCLTKKKNRLHATIRDRIKPASTEPSKSASIQRKQEFSKFHANTLGPVNPTD